MPIFGADLALHKLKGYVLFLLGKSEFFLLILRILESCIFSSCVRVIVQRKVKKIKKKENVKLTPIGFDHTCNEKD